MKNSTLTLRQACEGFVREKKASGKSEHTISDYGVTFKKLYLHFTEDKLFSKLTRADLVDFFSWLQTDYVSEPDGAAPRGKIELAPKTICNIHTNLSSLWTWAVREGHASEHIVRTIEKIRYEAPVIETFTKEQMETLLKTCDRKRTWKAHAGPGCERHTALRDRTIIRVLLDTGVRADELCHIRFQDLNLNTNTIRIFGKGKGRDKKERFVPIGKRTASSIWKYLTPRLDSIKDNDMIFLAGPQDDLHPMTRDVLGKLLRRIGNSAGVHGVYPHRFRHTFAINYIRNGGDLLTLQAILGHSSLDMVKRYARIAMIDTVTAHQKAGPVDNWRL